MLLATINMAPVIECFYLLEQIPLELKQYRRSPNNSSDWLEVFVSITKEIAFEYLGEETLYFEDQDEDDEVSYFLCIGFDNTELTVGYLIDDNYEADLEIDTMFTILKKLS